MIRRKSLIAIFTIIIFMSLNTLRKMSYLDIFENLDLGTKKTLFVMITISMVLASLFLIIPKSKILSSIGLQGKVLIGLGIALVITFPMLIGYSAVSTINKDITLGILFHKAFLPAILEEILFRGFLFGLLFRFCKWGFIPAALLSALIFASGHLYQANDFGTALGVFAITGMGGLWFAWLYIEWDKNLWIPIFIHMLMNAYWGIFSMGTNAAGSFYGNLFRTLTITLSIIFTLIMIQKRKGLNISKSQLFVNENSENIGL